MAVTGSDSFSSGSILSDTDLETINSEELVIFHSPQTMYSNKKDIVAIYSLGNAVDSSPKDWIGLFKSGWQTMYDFSAYQWVPFDPVHACQPRKRRTIFPQADIEDLFGRFQFLYVSGRNDVLGVSECFDVGLCDLVSSSESVSFLQENIPTSLSLISLGSQSSSSDDSSSWEISSEKVWDISKETTSCNPKSSALVPRNDYYTLSDWIIGNSTGGLYQKLHFVQPEDWRALLEEYEPVRRIYLSPRRDGKRSIEEIPSESPELTDGVSCRSTVCSDLVAVNNPAFRFNPPIPSGPLMVTLQREGSFPSQQSHLQMHQPNLLVSVMEEIKKAVPAAASKDQEAFKLPPCHKLVLADDTTSEQHSFSLWSKPWSVAGACPSPDQDHKRDTEFRVKMLGFHRKPVLDFKRGEPVENDDSTSQPVKQIAQADCGLVRGDSSVKRRTSTSERNTRKKRSVQRSKTKTNRSKQELMLQEALALSSKPSSSRDPFASPENPGDEAIENAVPTPLNSEVGRKRRSHNAAGINKAKRRCLNRRTSTPTVSGSHSVEDEGYSSLGEEDVGRVDTSYLRESLELLSAALTEALKNNAELHVQLSKVTNRKTSLSDGTSCTTTAVHKEKPSQCDKPLTSGKAVNTDKQKKRDAAANTSRTAKKNSPVQCGDSRRRKATNTDRKTEHNAASNTPSVVKTDTPSQCVTTSAKCVNTVLALPTKDSESNTTDDCEIPPSSHFGRDSFQAGAEITPLDLTVYRAPPAPRLEEDPEKGLGEWKRVSSKKIVRLQKLMVRKKEEFARLCENAENHDKTSRALEATLQMYRSALSAESTKRRDAERELRELRIKFWELLASRRSQPWQQNAKESVSRVTYFEKQERELGTGLQLDLVERGKRTVQRAAEQTALTQPVSLSHPKVEVQEPLTKGTTASEKNPSGKSQSNQPEHNEHQGHRERHTIEADKAKRQPVVGIPLTATAKINGVPVRDAEVKKATCSSISFRKFLMPAMTALAETFGSSKSRTKNSSDESEPNTPPGSADLNGKSPSAGAFAKVTVSISAGIPSARSCSKHQKTGSKTKSGKRSSSTSKEKAKPESSKAPCQETFPDSSGDITLRRRHNAGQDPPKPEHRQVLPSPIILPYPRMSDGHIVSPTNALPQSECSKGDSFSVAAPAEETKWRPLNIPAKGGLDGDGAEGDVIASVVQPVQVCLAKHGGAGKGRPSALSHAPTEPVTRNQLAQAILSRSQQQPLAVCGVMKTASTSLPDVIQGPNCRGGSAFSWGGAKPDRTKPVSGPCFPSPFACFIRSPLTPTHTTTTTTTPIPLPAPSSTPLPAFSTLALPPSLASHVVTTQPLRLASQPPAKPARDKAQVLSLPLHQPPRPLTLPPRALHFDWVGACSDAVGRQVRQGRCLTCGMRFSPSVDRYLVEEHLYFHNTFTE